MANNCDADPDLLISMNCVSCGKEKWEANAQSSFKCSNCITKNRMEENRMEENRMEEIRMKEVQETMPPLGPPSWEMISFSR